MGAKLVEVTELYASNFRDPVATLRRIADEIEAGKYGAVGTVAIALLGDSFEIFGAGVEHDAGACALLFQAAIRRFAKVIEEHKH